MVILMNKSVMNRLLIFSSILFVLFVGMIGTAYADDMLSDYAITKKTANEWRDYAKDKHLGYGSNLWTLNTFLDDALYDYSKDFWMPIEPWEYMVCSRALSTQLLDTEKKISVAGGGIYNGVDAITVAAYRYVASRNDTFRYDVTWYIQPSGERGYMYSIEARGANSKRIIQDLKGAGQKTGDKGYLPFSDTVNYTKIVLTFLGEEHEYPIIEVKDANRQ